MRYPQHKPLFYLRNDNPVTQAIFDAFAALVRRTHGTDVGGINTYLSITPDTPPHIIGVRTPANLGLQRAERSLSSEPGQVQVVISGGSRYVQPRDMFQTLVSVPEYIKKYLERLLDRDTPRALTGDDEATLRRAIDLLSEHAYQGYPNSLNELMMYQSNIPYGELVIAPQGAPLVMSVFELASNYALSDERSGMLNDLNVQLTLLAQTIERPVMYMTQTDRTPDAATMATWLTATVPLSAHIVWAMSGALPSRSTPLSLDPVNTDNALDVYPKLLVDDRWFAEDGGASLRDRYAAMARDLNSSGGYTILTAESNDVMPYIGAKFDNLTLINTAYQLHTMSNWHLLAIVKRLRETNGVSFADAHRAMRRWRAKHIRVAETGRIIQWATALSRQDIETRRVAFRDAQGRMETARQAYTQAMRARDAAALNLQALENAEQRDYQPDVAALLTMVENGTITSVNVENDQLHVDTPMVYIQDDRSSAWHRIGKMRISINMTAGRATFRNLTLPSERSPHNGMLHPHIFPDGHACYGSRMSEAVADCIIRKDWLTLLEMCLAFLEQANTDDPAGKYVHMWPFVQDPASEGLPPYEGIVKPREDGRYDTRGFDRRTGIHRDTGTNYDPNGYNIEGYNADGYDRFGWNRRNLHRDTGTQYGPDGFSHNGYDREGYDREGYDRDGYNRDGYNDEGYDRDGEYNEDYNTRYEDGDDE